MGNWLAAWSLGPEEAEDAFQQLMTNPDVDEQAKSRLSQEHENRKSTVRTRGFEDQYGGLTPQQLARTQTSAASKGFNFGASPEGFTTGPMDRSQLPPTDRALIDQRTASAGASEASAGASTARAGYWNKRTDGGFDTPTSPERKPPTQREFERGFDKALKQIRQDAGIWEKEDSTGRNVFTGDYYPEKLRKFGAEAVADSTMTAKQWARNQAAENFRFDQDGMGGDDMGGFQDPGEQLIPEGGNAAASPNSSIVQSRLDSGIDRRPLIAPTPAAKVTAPSSGSHLGRYTTVPTEEGKRAGLSRIYTVSGPRDDPKRTFQAGIDKWNLPLLTALSSTSERSLTTSMP